MSIYATWLSLDDEVPGDEPGQRSPIVYLGSHILPSDDDSRDGSVDVAAIPGFIEREGRPALADAEETVWPWLRLSVNYQTVILDRRQVAGLHETLGEWLKRCAEATT